MRVLRRIFFIGILVVVFFGSFVSAQVELTLKEQVWIEKNPVIKIGTGLREPYVYGDGSGDLVGISVDFTNLINKYAGTNMQIVEGVWSDILEQAINGSIDGVSPSGNIESREPFFFFSDPYIVDYLALVLPAESSLVVNELNDLSGKIIAIEKENAAERRLVESIPGAKVLVSDSETESIRLMREDKADATAIISSTYSEHNRNYLGLIKIGYIVKENPLDVVYSINKDSPELVSIINKALRSISQVEKNTIYDKWFGKIAEPKEKREILFEEVSIELKALQIRDQIEHYMRNNPEKTVEQLQNDEAFRKIVLQQIGRTGQSALVESTEGIIAIHINRDFEGVDVHSFQETLPVLWRMIEKTIGPVCRDSFGSYIWKEEDGTFRNKYAYQACIRTKTVDDKSFYVTAATYPEEYEDVGVNGMTVFARDSIEQKAHDVAKQIEIYLNAYSEKTLEDLQDDMVFKDIATQKVGVTGYVAVLSYNDLVTRFHPDPTRVNTELESLETVFPELWEIMKGVRRGYDSFGTYEFTDPDGGVRDKYTYVATVGVKTADGVGLSVAATTYLDEYDKLDTLISDQVVSDKEDVFLLPMIWIFVVLAFIFLFLFLLDKFYIIKLEKNAIMFLLAIALLLMIGLFVFNAYGIAENLEAHAVDDHYDVLDATASVKYTNIEKEISHLKNAIESVSSQEHISTEELRKIDEIDEDISELFLLGPDGTVLRSSGEFSFELSESIKTELLNNGNVTFVTNVHFQDAFGEASFMVSTPHNENLLVAWVNAAHIKDIVSENVGLGKTGESLLAYRDEEGDAVFFTERRFETEIESRDVIPKEDVEIPITQALQGREDRFSEYVDYRGVPVFSVTRYIDEIDVGFVVKLDREEVIEDISGSINWIWYSTSGIIIAIIIIALVFNFLITGVLRKEVASKTDELQKVSLGLGEKVGLLEKSERNLTRKTVQLKRFLNISAGREKRIIDLKKQLKKGGKNESQ